MAKSYIMDVTAGWGIPTKADEIVIYVEPVPAVGDFIIWNDSVYRVVEVGFQPAQAGPDGFASKGTHLKVLKMADAVKWHNGDPALPAGVPYPADDSYWYGKG